MDIDFSDLKKEHSFHSEREIKEIKVSPTMDPNSIFKGLGKDDLDWFAFENKVRYIISMMIDPV